MQLDAARARRAAFTARCLPRAATGCDTLQGRDRRYRRDRQPPAPRHGDVRPDRRAPPDRDPVPDAGGRRRPLSGSSAASATGRGLGRRLPRRPRAAARGRPLPRRRRATLAEAELRRIDAHLGRRPLGGRVRRRPARPLAVHDRGLDRRVRDLARRAAAQGRRRPGRPRPASSRRGSLLLEAAAERATGDGRPAARSRTRSPSCDDPRAPEAASTTPRSAPSCSRRVERDPERPAAVSLDRRSSSRSTALRARFGAWYELFPRSWGGCEGVERAAPAARRARLRRHLPAADPPDRPHQPQGPQQRADRRRPATPASPWAIGDATGGHNAIHPDLGTIEDFGRLAAAAREHGIDIALDFAIQCSADHPWLTEHPEWFHRRPDGTLKYAENPPKRYQDIYNVNWDSPDWRGLWGALRDVVLHWVDRGVTGVPRRQPAHEAVAVLGVADRVGPRASTRDVIFLAEAFTRAR